MSLRARLRRYFIAGLVVITPIGATWLILSWLFLRLDAILGEPLQRLLPFPVPGLGLLLLLAVILLLGWLAYQTVGRRLIRTWDRLLVQFPLTATIYTTTSQIIQMVMGRREKLVRRVVLVPFPTEGSWALAFVTSEESKTVSATLNEPYVNVFMPTTPNPTSGFLIAVRRDRVRHVEISVEDAMKLIISAGAIDRPGAEGVPARGGLDMDRLLSGTDE